MDFEQYEKKFEIFEEYCRLKENKKYLDYGYHQYVPKEHIEKLKEDYKNDMIKFLNSIENYGL